jgi:DNA-binding CsgD family transcriptional regulator
MLSSLRPGLALRAVIPPNPYVQPLVNAAMAGVPLEPSLLSLIRDLRFDSFMYGMCTHETRPNHESRGYVWTTLPRQWVIEYDRNAYVEIDPRLSETWNRTSPLIWDAATIGGSGRVRNFLSRAAVYGVRSGVVVSFQDPAHARIIVALNSNISPVDRIRRTMIERQLGEIMLLATGFHDIFMAHFVERDVPPRQEGAPLSSREIQCLELAARGRTSGEIGAQLRITARTVDFHFSNMISKLGVRNRQEAIAKGTLLGLIGR